MAVPTHGKPRKRYILALDALNTRLEKCEKRIEVLEADVAFLKPKKGLADVSVSILNYPRQIQQSYYALLAQNTPTEAEIIGKINHRCRTVESMYLNTLVRDGIADFIRPSHRKLYFIRKP